MVHPLPLSRSSFLGDYLQRGSPWEAASGKARSASLMESVVWETPKKMQVEQEECDIKAGALFAKPPYCGEYRRRHKYYHNNGGVDGQILVELRAIKVSQEETRRETKEQLDQLNTHLKLLSTRVSQVEQRVSDLEDTNNQVEATTSRVQSELEDLQNKLDEMENRSRRSNLRFVGVPEEMEAGSSVTKVVSELIGKIILPDRANPEGDLSIMRAHRVPFVRPVNSKYPRTILVSFGDFRIKEQILSQARKVREFKLDDNTRFRVFSDMLVAAAHRRHEFVGLIDDFKRWGASAGIVQLVKLKVQGSSKSFPKCPESKEFLAAYKKTSK
ncbi:hypothetical protein NDU88_009898 [Pleurodeles waltl]|uniref:L1 transposable element RRM domain-containing protein n=1 Tax=Pleurodeles waltl TaxID=8319 RepID=A0AAV7Q0B3_PLEWA|nr:hypothetical protein NDU88_009898 [Pleurodeles waltl]